SCPPWSASATTPATTARPAGPPCSTGSSSAPRPDPPLLNGADHHARHHPRPRRRRRTRRGTYLPYPVGIRPPETRPRRELRRLHRPPGLQHRPPLRRAGAMTSNTSPPHSPLDKITRITPIPRGWFLRGPSVRAHADQPDLCE